MRITRAIAATLSFIRFDAELCEFSSFQKSADVQVVFPSSNPLAALPHLFANTSACAYCFAVPVQQKQATPTHQHTQTQRRHRCCQYQKQTTTRRSN
jgi:hypothetical protein